MPSDASYPCPECQLGTLEPRTVSFFTVRNGQPVTVPDFPAWVCDVCGRREYDSAALAELQAMLDSVPNRFRRGLRRQPPSDRTPPARQDESRRRP